MATMLGISRTPVREVFKRLEAEGLVEIYPQIGTIIAPIDPKKVRDYVTAEILPAVQVTPSDFNACMDSPEAQQFVKDSMAFVSKLGIRSAPVMFLNGRPVLLPPTDMMWGSLMDAVLR